MKQPDWLGIAQDAIRNCEERVIHKDSDGNCFRVTYREGAAEAAAEAMAFQQTSMARQHVLLDTLKAYQQPVPRDGLLTT